MQKLVWQNADGVELDLTSGNYGITEWEGFSNTGLNIQSQQVPFQDGGVFLDALIEQRELTVTLAIQDNNNLTLRYQQRRELISALNPKLGEGYLIYTNDFISKRIKCIAQIPIFETHNSDMSGTPKATLSWTACEPYWEDLEETTVTFKGEQIIENNGDVPCQIKATLNAGAINPVLANKTNEKQIGLDGTYGQNVYIDTNFGNKKVEEEREGFRWLCGGGVISMPTSGIEDCCYGNGKIIYVGCVCFVENYLTGERTPINPNTFLTSIAFNNSLFVGVGWEGAIVTSPDGITWTSRTSGTSQDLNSIEYSETLQLFVAVGKNGTLITSPDGITWTSRTISDMGDLKKVKYRNNKFFVCGSRLSTSTDGITWTSQTALDVELYDIEYGNELYMLVGYNYGGSVTSKIYTSTDGTTWTEKTIPSTNPQEINSVAYDGEYFYISCRLINNVDKGFIYKSTDGTSWNLEIENDKAHYFNIIKYVKNQIYALSKKGEIITTSDGVNWEIKEKGLLHQYYDLIFAQGKFYAVGDIPVGGYDNIVISTSTDGKDWTVVYEGENQYARRMRKMLYANGMFVIVGEQQIITSQDGINWTLTEINDNLYDVIYAQGKYIAVGYANDNVIYKSTDGINWSVSATSIFDGSTYRGIAYGNGKYVICGTWADFQDPHVKFLVSSDCENWETVTPALNGNQSFGAVRFLEGMFIAFGDINSYLISIATSVDGLTWKEAFQDNTFPYSTGGGFTGKQFVALGSSQFKIPISANGVSWDYTETGVNGAVMGMATGNGKTIAMGNVVIETYLAEKTNIISSLIPTSDMTFNLQQGENDLLYLTDNNTEITITYRQKYIGV